MQMESRNLLLPEDRKSYKLVLTPGVYHHARPRILWACLENLLLAHMVADACRLQAVRRRQISRKHDGHSS